MAQDEIERDPSKVDFTKDGQRKLFPDNPSSDDNMLKYRSKVESKFFDPCAEASKMSMNCLERNNYERPPCKPYFEAYRDCLKEFRENLKKR